MKPADLLKNNYPPNILIHGPAGSCKTALVSQASNGYMLDFDDGMRTAALWKDKFFNARQGIEFDIFVDKNVQKPVAFMNAKRKLLQIAAQCAAGTWTYDACIVDSFTGMCKACQLYIMSLPSKNNPQGDSMAQPEQNHWGPMVNEIESMLLILRSINVMTIITAHSFSLEVDGIEKFFPSSITKPHGQKKLTWLFDEVWSTKVKRGAQSKTNFIISGKSTPSIEARTRSGLIDDVDFLELGLVGLLKKISYDYGKKKEIKTNG